MKMKKFGALVMAGVMALSLVTSALATSVDVTDAAKGANVKVTGTTMLPTIKLTVPASAGIVLNPYKMKLATDLSAVDTASGTATTKVVSAIYNIENLSNVKVKVGVTATGTATGVTFAKASVAAIENKDKQAFVKMEMITGNASITSAGTAFDSVPDTQTLILSTTAAKLATPIELAAGTGTALGTTGGVLSFRFTGDTSKTPTTPWTAKDTVGATLAFTFIPQDAA